MSTAAATHASDLSPRRWYQLGGVAAFTSGLGYIVIFPLYAHVGPPPRGGEAWITYLPGKVTMWWAIVAISVFTDFLYVPIALALYLRLRDANKDAMRLATTFIGLFVVLDLSVTWSHYTSILVLYREYSVAGSEAARQAYLGAIDYASAVLTSRLEVVYAIVTLSLGIFVASLVMLKARFGRVTAWLGVLTGLSGVAALSGLGVATIANALFATAWLFALGYRLYVTH